MIAKLSFYVTVDTAIRLRVGHCVVQVRAGERFIVSKTAGEALGPTQPPFGVYRGLFARDKAAET